MILLLRGSHAWWSTTAALHIWKSLFTAATEAAAAVAEAIDEVLRQLQQDPLLASKCRSTLSDLTRLTSQARRPAHAWMLRILILLIKLQLVGTATDWVSKAWLDLVRLSIFPNCQTKPWIIISCLHYRGKIQHHFIYVCIRGEIQVLLDGSWSHIGNDSKVSCWFNLEFLQPASYVTVQLRTAGAHE
jgi:plasmid stabilization system protein ParE